MTETITTSKADAPEREHLAAVADGCGCAEIWEHLSETRDEDD